MSDVITPEPCHVCRENVADAFSNELNEPVCAECVTRLRWADAWIKAVNAMVNVVVGSFTRKRAA